MRFAYQAFDASGVAHSGSFEADSAEEATAALREKGLFVTRIEAASGKPQHAGGGFKLPMGKGKRLKQLAMSTRQLQVLIATGTPIGDALIALERQARDEKWKAVVTSIRQRVEQGDALSEAMAEHPQHFSVIYRSLIAAGESGGKLPEMLDRLAKMLSKEIQIRSSITGAMMYPGILITVATSVLITMIVFVLPRFTGLFKSLDVPMPPTTVFLMAVSSLLRSYWWALLLLVVLGGIAAHLWLRTERGRLFRDTLLIRLPLLAKLVRNLITARLARMLGVLISGHVPLMEALALTREAAGNLHYAKLIGKAEKYVEHGEAMSLAFADEQLIEPAVYEAVRNGEATGQTAQLLLMMSDFMDEENDTVIRSLTSILEPVILIVLGLVIGLVAVSMFLPLFDLTAMAGG